eukprot:11295472-Alexandrium_andersonii.AAC.1
MPILLQACEPGTARAQKWPDNWSQKLWTNAFCAAFRADSESANEIGRRGRRRRLSGESRGRSPPPGKSCATQAG